MLEISLMVIQWIFFAYTSYRIGKKLNIQESYPWYIIPLWNFWILAKKTEMKLKRTLLVLSLVLILSIISLFLWSYFSIEDFDVSTFIFIVNRLAPELITLFIAIIIMFAIFWGNVARKMGKDYWVYFLFGLLSPYIPPLLLAFESIEKMITTNRLSNMYSPLSGEEKEVYDRANMLKERIDRTISVGVLGLIAYSVAFSMSRVDLPNISFIILGVLFSFILYRIGKTISTEKSYAWYLMPIQIFWTLVKNSDIKVVAVFVLGVVINMFLIDIDSNMKNNITYALLFVFLINFFGSIARSLGKSYWLYGLLSLFLLIDPRFIFVLFAMFAFNFIDDFFTFKNFYRDSIEGKRELNKNEIKKYLWFVVLVAVISYGWNFYKKGEKNRINTKYEMLCDKNISDYNALYETVYTWINEGQVTADSLSYVMLLKFIDDDIQHKVFMDFYKNILDENSNDFPYAFNKAFSKVMNLKESERKTFKKENICQVYQTYIIDVGMNKVDINDEVEQFCDGLIVSKRFIEEKI